MSATANTGQPGGPGHTGGLVFTMAGAPTVDNDGTAGYHVSDRIVDTTNGRIYLCVDNSTGAAQWVAGGRERNRNLTSNTTLLASESGTHITNLGASAHVTVTLPQSPPAGTRFSFTLLAAQQLRIQPGAAGAIYGAFGSGAYAKLSDNKYCVADAIGEQIELIADGNGDWISRGDEGTWTNQA